MFSQDLFSNIPDFMEDIEEYIRGTYGEHYAPTPDGVQLIDLIYTDGSMVTFCKHNIMKYAFRLERKDGLNRKDVMKIFHYNMMLLQVLEYERNITASTTNNSTDYFNPSPVLRYTGLATMGNI